MTGEMARVHFGDAIGLRVGIDQRVDGLECRFVITSWELGCVVRYEGMCSADVSRTGARLATAVSKLAIRDQSLDGRSDGSSIRRVWHLWRRRLSKASHRGLFPNPV